MKVYKTVKGIQRYLENERNKNKSIGFSPTMGALHEGHISLVNYSKSENDISVVSIFVNPTQFNNKSDLDKYPRVVKEDLSLLRKNKVDVVFLPNEKQIYPPKQINKIEIDLNGLDLIMEGEHRPGHFEGVVQVVKRLLDIVMPTNLYMGQKDFQQFTIIQHMIAYFKINTKLRVVPIKRASNGLALSSRNRRLSQKQQIEAGLLYNCLSAIAEKVEHSNPKEISDWAMAKFKNAGFDPEYFILADGYTLKSISKFSNHSYVVACTAVWVHGVRLIDNMIIIAPK